MQVQALAKIIIIYILEITMEKFKIFNKILILLLIMNLYVYIPTKDNLAYSQPIKTNQVFFDGLKGEKIGKKFDAKIYIKDEQDIEGCFYAHRKNINGVSYKFIDNTLVEIEFHNKIFISPHGVHIGENASKLRKYHNKGRVVRKHPYGGNKDTVEFYWTGNLGVKYIITNGKITSFSVGKKGELPYLEGCL